MLGYDTFLREIKYLCENIGDSIFFSLLLIRSLSRKNAPGFHTLPHFLWNQVLESKSGDPLTAIQESLLLIKPSIPAAGKLWEQNRKQPYKKECLKQLIGLLSEIPEEDTSLCAIYEDFFRFQTAFQENPSDFGDFYTPKDVAQLLARLLCPDQGTAYDPCCGSGALLFAVQNCANQNLTLFGQTLDEKSYVISQINSHLSGTSFDLGKAPANTLLHDQHENKQFDYIISNPPFNLKNWFDHNRPYGDPRWTFGAPPQSNANFAWLQHILSHLSPDGRSAVILPNSTLTTQTHSESSIRRAIVLSRQVEAVITLPPGLFNTTRIPFCIWLLSGPARNHQDILFIAAEKMIPPVKKPILPEQMEQIQNLVYQHRHDTLHGRAAWYGIASLHEIEENDFILSPNRYLASLHPQPAEIHQEYTKFIHLTEELSMLPIENKVMSCIQQWKDAEIPTSWQQAALLDMYDVFGGLAKKKEFWGSGLPVLDVKTVIHTPFVPDHFQSYAEVTPEERIKYSIRRGDVFLNRTSESIQELACCCVALKDQDAVYSGFLKRLRPKGEWIDPLYAACFFLSEIYRWEVEKAATVYTTRASLNNNMLSGISIYFPDAQTQRRLGETLFSLFQYRQLCHDEAHCRLLEEFEQQLIRHYITYPILYLQNKDGNGLCR